MAAVRMLYPVLTHVSDWLEPQEVCQLAIAWADPRSHDSISGLGLALSRARRRFDRAMMVRTCSRVLRARWALSPGRCVVVNCGRPRAHLAQLRPIGRLGTFSHYAAYCSQHHIKVHPM